MMSILKTGLVILSVSGLLGHPAFGETWSDWLTPDAASPLRVTFVNGWNVDPRLDTLDEYSGRNDPFEPNRGYEGDLLIEAEGTVTSLTVRLLHSVLHPDAVLWKASSGPEVIPVVEPGRIVAQSEWALVGPWPQRIPVLLPMAVGSQGESSPSGRPPALATRCEIRDASGRVLHRSVLPLRRLGESERTLLGKDERDEAMQSVSSRQSSIDRVGDLPESMHAYRQVKGIWFSESLWRTLEGREVLLRRLLLSGVSMSATTGLVERIRERLGTGYKGRVLIGDVTPDDWNQGDTKSLRSANYDYNGDFGFAKQRVPSPFENEAELFAPHKDSYLLLTFVGLGIYGLGAVIILVRVFGRMKGERRTVIWWGLPLWTVFATAGISVGGMLFLERRDQVDVTEYRLLMRDWPEMHCRAVATAMTFAPGRAEWTLPPEAVVYRSSHDALDGFWKRQESTHSADSFRLRMPRQMSGTLLQLEAGWFAPAHSPITLQLPESKDGVGNDRAVHATEDLDGVYVLHDGQWFGLGAMKAGEKRSLLQGPTQRLATLHGLPQALHDVVHPWTMGRGCQDPSHNHQLHAVPLTDSIVVAWRRGEVPQVRPVWDNAVTKGRIIWVMQCPR